MKIGAHVSTTGGFEKALQKLVQMGGNTLQIFSTSPRGWNFTKVTPEQSSKFRSLKQQLEIDPVYFHASYLINLADEGKIGHLSKLTLIAELHAASQMGVIGSIIHLGSFKGQKTTGKYQTLITHIKEILDKTPENTFFIAENAGNRKIGQSLDELAEIVKDVANPRLKICLDTCHLFSAGYDLRTNEQLNVFLKDFNNKIGLNKLELWHVNDSRDAFASGHDRHENIGKGTIGMDEFKSILNYAPFKHLPFILEVPGLTGNGPDKANIDILKSLV